MIDDHLDELLPALLQLSSFQAAAAVRETALQCLTALMELPYARLHPHRRTVLKALAAAADDRKRSVRHAAVKARSVWSYV